MKPENKCQPPALATRFLHWFCADEVLETLEGDLHELYRKRRNQIGKMKADLLFFLDVFDVCRPFAFRKKNHSSKLIDFDMIQYYLKIAWRNLNKYRLYSLIKVGGFSLGIAACFLITLFIVDEINFDNHYRDKDRIFRLISNYNNPGDHRRATAFPAPIGKVLANEYPEIEAVARLIPYDWYNAGANQFRSSNQTQNNFETGFAYADPRLLEILEIPMVYGSSQTALSTTKSLVISEKIAQQYFPDTNPVGSTVILNENEDSPYTIGGVMQNFPNRSHLQFDFLLTLVNEEFWPGEQNNWSASNYSPYIKVKKGVSIPDLNKKLMAIRAQYIVPAMESRGDQRAESVKKYMQLELQPIGDIYLNSQGINDTFRYGDKNMVGLFGAIAFFILFIACINFINLSTAKSANRAKEVGLQKVLGSSRKGLIRQFLSESVLYSFISVMLGIGIAWFFLAPFNQLTEKALVFPWRTWWFLPSLLMTIILLGLIAGFYPAIYLSQFVPSQIFKGSVSRGSRSKVLRSGLVIFQFVISIVLIICTLISTKQMQYILHKKLGYDKEQIVMIQGAGTLGEKQKTLRSELKSIPQIKNVTISDYLPVSGAVINYNSFWKNGREKEDLGVGAQIWRIDEDYLNTLDIKLLKGRNFSREMASDSLAVIINETMAKKLGLTQPIDEVITNGFENPYHIIGVVQDFHFQSLKGEIEGLCLARGNFGSNILVKTEAGDVPEIISKINTLWDQFMPNQPLRYEFLDERYASMYADVKRSSKVFRLFAALAIFVACLGLFALSAFMVEQRTKEISVRKVLGASLTNIFSLLTKNFITLVLVAFVIALPIGWYLMQSWLQDFTYRVSITWDVFFVAGIIALLIATATISFETLKAAWSSPIKGIRSE